MRRRTLLTVLAAASIVTSHASAQQAPPTAGPVAPVAAPPTVEARMDKLADHYVEGPGYVTFFFQQTKGYGGTYEECEKNCLADARCKMIEFYKPLRKCHLYNHARWSGRSKDANVALKKSGAAAAK
jgi:hypothetical protein